MKEREEEEVKEGKQCAVVHCGPAAPAALLLLCLVHPVSGRQPITAQESSGTSIQCVRVNREGVDRDVREAGGGSKKKEKGGMEQADGERLMRGGKGTQC